MARVDQDTRDRERRKAEKDRKQEGGGAKGSRKKKQSQAPQVALIISPGSTTIVPHLLQLRKTPMLENLIILLYFFS